MSAALKLMEEVDNAFESELSEFITQRLENSYEKSLRRNEEYKACMEQIIKLQHLMIDKLGYETVEQLNALTGLMSGMESDAAYMAGLKDGMKLNKILDDIG